MFFAPVNILYKLKNLSGLEALELKDLKTLAGYILSFVNRDIAWHYSK